MAKRLVSPVILLTMVLLLAAACSSAPAASPTSAPAQPAAASQPTAAPTTAPPTVAPTVAPTAAPTAAPKAALAAFDEMSFDQVTTIGDQTATGKWAIKKGKVRMEMDTMGQQITFIADQDKKVAYMWSAGQNQAIKIPIEQFEQQTGSAPDPRELSKDAAQGKLVGTETIDGQLSDVYEIAGSTSTIKTWVAKSNGFPVKSELKTPDGVITTEFKNVKTSGVADSLFELPAGMQVMDLGNMPGGGLMPGGTGGIMPPGTGVPPMPTPRS